MLGVFDLSQNQSQSSDLSVLRAYLQQLVGQPFVQIRFSYGDELTLHFGTPQPYSSPRLKHLLKGSYIIGARASAWLLTSPPKVISGLNHQTSALSTGYEPITQQHLETSGLIRPGVRIVAVDAFIVETPGNEQGFGLSLSLADTASLVILPQTAQEEESSTDVADWEIFTPYEQYFRVGPHLQWSYLSSR